MADDSYLSMTLTTTQLISTLQWRYATKQFDPTRKIPADVWAAIEESLVLTPSSFGLQPWKFLVIQDPALRFQLLAESWKQPQVTAASHYVVLTARTDLTSKDVDAWMACMAEAQGVESTSLAGYKGVVEGFAQALSKEERHQWNARQVYIALGQLLLSAALLGLDACPMEGISREGYDQVLGIAGSGHTTVLACALGYRAGNDNYRNSPKARFPSSQMIEHL